MDISNLTYEELMTLEKDIIKRRAELKRAKYESLVNDVINAIRAITKAGFEDTVCFYDSDSCSWAWGDLIVGISDEYERRKREDY